MEDVDTADVNMSDDIVEVVTVPGKRKISATVWDNFYACEVDYEVENNVLTNRRLSKKKDVCVCLHCSYIHPYSWKKHVDYAKKHLTDVHMKEDKSYLRQTTLNEPRGIKALTSQEQFRFQELISDWFYETGTSFMRIEHPKFRQAMQILRLDAQLPTRQRLADANLVQSFENVYNSVHQTLYS